jgi:hypothetical protein
MSVCYKFNHSRIIRGIGILLLKAVLQPSRVYASRTFINMDGCLENGMRWVGWIGSVPTPIKRIVIQILNLSR